MIKKINLIGIKIFTFIIFVSCSVEEMNSVNEDFNKTDNQINKKSMLEIAQNVPKGNIELSSGVIIDALLEKKIREIVPLIEQTIPKPIQFDYQRIESDFSKVLMKNNNQKQINKYQFICDENERWIYRCNMESGEIECFSMSSNKLRLLSSIK